MEPGRRPLARIVAGLCAFVAFVLLGASSSCVTTAVEDDPVLSATPVVIEVPEAPTGTDRTLVEFYDSVLAQLHEAHQDRDQPRLQALIETYLRAGVPEWARKRLVGFRALALGLQFELHCEQRAEFAVPPPAAAIPGSVEAPSRDSIGVPLDYVLTLPPPPDGPWRLGGRADRDPVSFRLALVIREHFVDGSQKKIEDAEVVHLDHALVFDVEPLQLPVRLDLGDSEAVRRDVDIQVELLPGYVTVGDERAPIRRTVIASGRAVQWPPGHEVIRTSPLKTLVNAMKLGDREHFKHVRLAAEFASDAERTEVENSLMEWVRLGRADQALVAMATLRAITKDASAPIGDRDAWLLWWESRR